MNQTVLITGASRGIGLGFVRHYLEKNCSVIACARKPDSSTELIQLREKHPKNLTVVTLDVNSEKSVESLVSSLSKITALDILINNAGVMKGEKQDFENLNMKDIADTFDTNVLGPIRVTKALLPKLENSENPKIIHITSMMGSIADNSSGGYYAYRISKAALNMANKSMAIDFPEITCVVLHPGWVQTDMGGAGAPTEIEASVTGMASVIEGLTPNQTGKFYDFRGKELPW